MKKNKQKENTTATPSQRAERFMKDAQAFENNRFLNNKILVKVSWYITAVLAVVCIVQAFAIASVSSLKEVQHWLVRVEDSTGVTGAVTRLDETITTHGEVTDKYWLARYVSLREAYEWETIQGTYDATNLLSSDNVQAEFKQFYDHPSSPVKVLQNRARINVKVLSITFLGDAAQVRFEQIMRPTASGNAEAAPIVSRFIATMSYNYANLPTSEKDRLVNPIGFQVTTYRVDPENVK